MEPTLTVTNYSQWIREVPEEHRRKTKLNGIKFSLAFTFES